MSRALEASRKIGDTAVARTFGTGAGSATSSPRHARGRRPPAYWRPWRTLPLHGDRKYLDFCEYLVRSWDQPNGPKIAASLLATESVLQNGQRQGIRNESNLVGLVELYRITGAGQYLKPAEIALERYCVSPACP